MSNEAEKDILEYMKSQNRPYSASDVFLNLHKKHGKTAVVKAMENLSEQGKLLEKVYGKSKIYVVHQSQFPEVADIDLQKLDEEVTKLDRQITDTNSRFATVNAECQKVQASLTTSKVLANIEIINSEIEILEKRLAELKCNGPCMDPVKKNTMVDEHKLNISQWRKRKKMTTDLMNAVLEGYPKSKRQFLEEVGLETDESCSVSLPQT
ncbi:unnamed protein product [Clavelina lepadiformis]|uniref:Homologous-pairing protein 2 homolog n=1 Tax=Clavelina lepadiformis TaxID=159417 RepID=A0ABP0H4J5_CLALP